jgi:ABC-type sugar transport system substrate-binding protein
LITALCAAAVGISACGSSSGSGSSTASTESTGSETATTAPSGSEGDEAKPKVKSVLHEYKLPPIPKPKKKYKVYNLTAHQEDAFAVSTAEAAESFGEEKGIEVITLDAGGYGNVSKQIQQIETAVSQGADAIWISTTDENAVIPALEEAQKAGVKVLNWWSRAAPVFKASATVTVKAEDYGFAMATALIENMGGEGDIYSILGGAGSSYERELKLGREKALKDFPNVDLVGEQVIPDFDPTKVQTLTENILTSNPEIKGIFTATTGMAVGVYTGSQAVGKGGEISTAGMIIQECPQLELLQEEKLPIILGAPSIYYAQLITAVTIRMLDGLSYEKLAYIPGNVYTAENIHEAPLDLEIEHHFIAECQSEIEEGA